MERGAKPIRIIVRKPEGRSRYIATSPDVEGFLASGDTFEQVIERVPGTLESLYEAKSIVARRASRSGSGDGPQHIRIVSDTAQQNLLLHTKRSGSDRIAEYTLDVA